MKYFKRLGCFVMALIMLCSLMTIPAFADNTVTSGSITISNAEPTSTYELYKMLTIDTHVEGTNQYTYRIVEGWADFFTQMETKHPDWFTVTGDLVSWDIKDSSAEINELLAKEALAYATTLTTNQTPTVSPVRSTKNPGDYSVTANTIVFANLDLGYYLIDSTVGVLCGLSHAYPDGFVIAKNKRPVIDKMVYQANAQQWHSTNSASIGDYVQFRTTITIQRGAQNYILHDKMDPGLTFINTPDDKTYRLRVEHNPLNQTAHDSTYGVDFTVEVNPEQTKNCIEGGCDFHVIFDEDFLNRANTGDSATIYYYAQLNDHAKVGAEGNTNMTHLEYGENNNTTNDSTTTYTYAFDLVKTDETNTLIDGAQFMLYKSAEGDDVIPVKAVRDDPDNVYYLLDTDATGNGDSIVVKDGMVQVRGLGKGTYYLAETVKPEGYNALSSRATFTITDENLEALFVNKEGVQHYTPGSGVHVINKAGNMMPETGGIGTTLFYVGGGIMVFAAVVLLITKKRMAAKD